MKKKKKPEQKSFIVSEDDKSKDIHLEEQIEL